jgi:DNA-binding GntR family transcriptional regulator
MLAQVDRSSGDARHQAYLHLREAIVKAALEPGRQLSEQELAEQLGVSRTPVREALVRLRDDRLVEIMPQLGTFVTPISLAAVNDAQFVREALECAAVRLAAERAGPEDVAALRALLRGQRECRDAGDVDRFDVLDNELHSALCELSGHGIAWAVARRANGHLDRVRRLSLPRPRYLEEMVAEHELVVEAVARQDPDAAEAALRHHLQMVLSGLDGLRAEHPGYFEEER